MNIILIFNIIFLLCTACNPVVQNPPVEADTLTSSIPADFMYQYSIIDALLAGVYDGNMTFGELKQKGDFGVGSFNRLDGELIMNEGKVYKMRFDGSIQPVADADSTGIAFVKFFKADTSFLFTNNNMTYAQLQEQLNNLLPPNKMYALRIKGTFKTLHGRAPAPASKPYPPLQQYLTGGGQKEFHFTNTTGTCVGFLMPDYMARVNVPGYHLHYISDDHKNGGHIFEFTSDRLAIEVDFIKGYVVEPNTDADFAKVDLSKNRQKELEEIE
ncbi:MAG: acetolactate decarboxylase [Saprospiraceae bacterium]